MKAVLLVVALLVLGACDGGRFDAEVWKAQRFSGARDNPRAAMTADLRPRLTPGMTRAEVEALLGGPDSEERAGVARYSLGAGYGVDYDYFTVHYDPAGRLVRTGHERD